MNIRLTGSTPSPPTISLGVAGEYGVTEIRLLPDREWDDLTIQAVFHGADGSKTKVTGNPIRVPGEATAKATTFLPGRLVITGFKEGVRRISADVTYTVQESAGIEADNAREPTPTELEQLWDFIRNIKPEGGDIAQAVADYLREHPIQVTETDPTVPEWAKQPNPPQQQVPTEEIREEVRKAIRESGHYTKPVTGIPASDLDQEVQNTLGQIGDISSALAILIERGEALA